jgi:hypothetical protein
VFFRRDRHAGAAGFYRPWRRSFPPWWNNPSASLLNRRPPSFGGEAERNKIGRREAVRFVAQACGALDSAHQNHIVHRDINIMFICRWSPTKRSFSRPARALCGFGAVDLVLPIWYWKFGKPRGLRAPGNSGYVAPRALRPDQPAPWPSPATARAALLRRRKSLDFCRHRMEPGIGVEGFQILVICHLVGGFALTDSRVRANPCWVYPA